MPVFTYPQEAELKDPISSTLRWGLLWPHYTWIRLGLQGRTKPCKRVLFGELEVGWGGTYRNDLGEFHSSATCAEDSLVGLMLPLSRGWNGAITKSLELSASEAHDI